MIKGAPATRELGRIRRMMLPPARGYAAHFSHRGLYRVLRLMYPPGSLSSPRVVRFGENNLKLEVETNTHIGWWIYMYGAYRPQALNALASIAAVGQTVLDVGASIGDATVMLAQAVGSTGWVHAFEPSPLELRRCRANIALNHQDRVTLNELAISDIIGSLDLFLAAGVNQSNSSLERPRDGEYSVVRVGATTIDAYCAHLKEVDLIKIDTQGADIKALRGARATLSRCQPSLIFTSVAPFLYQAFGDSLEDLLEVLRQSGYYYEWASRLSERPNASGVLVARPANHRTTSGLTHVNRSS